MSGRGDTPLANLARFFGPEALAAIERYIDQRVRDELAAVQVSDPGPTWLTLAQAAERLGCSADAVRMRVRRGRLDARHQGRRLYVSAASVHSLTRRG